ncbi:hypothetical protein LINGRAHAP2_LOCUS36457 [Linum grandiflorum]
MSSPLSLNHQHTIFVLEYQDLCNCQWKVKRSHIYREAKCVADYLVNFGHSYTYDLHYLFRQIGVCPLAAL